MSNIIAQLAALLEKNKEESAVESVSNAIVPPKAPPQAEESVHVNPMLSEEEYRKLLSKDQLFLKENVSENHEPLEADTVSRLLLRLQSDISSVTGIFITDRDFDHLFIFQNAENFLNMARDMDGNIDFTYLYARTKGGPKYYGIDEYTSEITHLFEDIEKALESGSIRSKEDLQKIKNINIFQNIYTDFL